MPQGDWVQLRTSWTPSAQPDRSSARGVQRSVFSPRFWEGTHTEMPFPNPLRRWRRPELPPVDGPLLPDDEAYGGARRTDSSDAHADFTNPMSSPFGQDTVQHPRTLRWEDEVDGDTESAAGGESCANPASCLPPLLHRRRLSSAASASAAWSRSGGSVLALQSLSSRRLAAAAAAVPDPPTSSPPQGARSKQAHQEDMSQASEWLFGSGARPEFLAHADSWSTIQLADAAPDRHYTPLPSGPEHKAGSRASRARQRLCCCFAPSAVQP